MFRRQRTPLSHLRPQRIALIKPSALGDIAHSLPVLNALRMLYPTAMISWVANRAYLSILEQHQSLDEVIPFDRTALRGGIGKTVSYSYNFLKDLRRRRFDLVVDLQGLARTGLMCLATAAPRRVGLGTAREGSKLSYTDLIPTPNADRQHAIDRYWLVIEALGGANLPKKFDLPVDPTAQEWVGQQLADCPRPWLMFGVGARWLTKRWPPAHFAHLARAAQQQFGGTAIFVGAADEAEIAQTVRNQLAGPARNFCGGSNLPQLVALLAAADVMVSNDTGPLHLAVALGRPCVAPYLCTSATKHGPYGQTGGVETNVWCKSSYIRQCDRLECMTELTPDRLQPLLFAILSSWKQNSLSVLPLPVLPTVGGT
ncbi:MAG: glycosyltransferase family 9 protein [Zavarzinella sp.]